MKRTPLISGNPPAARAKAIRWILFLTFIHTVPSPWIYFVLAGWAPTSALFVVGMTGSFLVTEHTPFLALFFLAPALLYSLGYYFVAWLLEAIIIRLRGKAVQISLVFLICALLLISAFLPIYGTGGHSGTKYVSIIGLWQITRLSDIWLFGYSVLFVAGLSGLLTVSYLDVQVRWPRLRPFWHSAFGKPAVILISAGVLAGFVYLNRVLLICRPLGELGLTSAQMCMGRALLAVDRNKLWGEKNAKYWFERAALNGNKEAAWALYRMPSAPDDRLKWLEFAAERGDAEAQYELYHRLVRVRRTDEGLKQAINWLKAAAENAHPKAQYDLAKLYRRGLRKGGVSRNLPEARRWLERAAEQGHKQAMWEIANRYEHGTERFSLDLNQAKRFYLLYARASRQDQSDGQPMIGSLADAKSRIASIHLLLHRLERGDPATLRMFAFRHLEAYEPGPGVREKGLKLLERLGKQGDTQAQFDLGSIYMFGRYQVPKDQTLGKTWWRRAAKGHHTKAMERLADGYTNGNFGFTVDYLKAKSQVEALIRIYREGLNGAHRDEQRAQRWERELAFLDRGIERTGGIYQSPETLRSQASENDADAQYQLARQLSLHSRTKNGPEILDLYRKAAANGHAGAQMELFRLYQRGLSYTSTRNPGQVNVVIAKDQSKALRYLKQAADNGHPKALGELALAYEKGRFGLSRDLSKARDLYQKIIRANDDDRPGWELEERLINMYRKRLEYTRRAIEHTEERNKRYQTATDVEKRIMDIEARYQREYTRQANSVCAKRSRCTKEYIRNQRELIRRDVFAERDREILRYRRSEHGRDLD